MRRHLNKLILQSLESARSVSIRHHVKVTKLVGGAIFNGLQKFLRHSLPPKPCLISHERQPRDQQLYPTPDTQCPRRGRPQSLTSTYHLELEARHEIEHSGQVTKENP